MSEQTHNTDGLRVITNGPETPFTEWLKKVMPGVQVTRNDPAKAKYEWRWNETEIGIETKCGQCGQMHEPDIEPAPFLIGSDAFADPVCRGCWMVEPSAFFSLKAALTEAHTELKAAIAALHDVALRLSVTGGLANDPLLQACVSCGQETESKLPGAVGWRICDKCWDEPTWPNFPDLVD